MSITDAKNGDLKSLVRAGNGNGANGKDISTLKSPQSTKKENQEAQENGFSYGLTNPFQKTEQVESALELKPRFSEKIEVKSDSAAKDEVAKIEKSSVPEIPLSYSEEQKATEKDIKILNKDRWIVRNGHNLTYFFIFLFSFVLYFRPYEWIPGFSELTSLAMILAVATLLIYIPSQLSVEGSLTILTTEVKCILFLAIWALLTIPIAKDPGTAWKLYNETFIKIVLIFIIMVNTLRTRARLMGLMWLSIGIGVMLSVEAINLYRAGKFAVEGYRVEVDFGGMFGNPNDMALHLVMFTPLAIILGIISKNKISKIFCFTSAALMVAANMVTQSRGGFLGLIAVAGVLVWKLSKQNRIPIILISLFIAAIVITLAPGNYWIRILSIFIPGLDAVGSSNQRKELLQLSLLVTARNPLGIGIGNFPIVGIQNLQTHNAYTQISSELGWLSLIAYLVFMISPLRKLAAIERQMFLRKDFSWIYYLSIGIQVTIIGYMVSSFFGSVAYQWFIYYPVAYAVCLRRIYNAQKEEAGSAFNPNGLSNYFEPRKE